MSTHIIGIGAFVPEQVVTNIDLQRLVDTNDEWIVSRTGIRERRIAEPGQSCSMLGVEAAKRALEDAKIAATDVTHVLVATFSPDAYIPSTAYILREKLGIPRGMAMDVSAACTGFLFALETARAFVALSGFFATELGGSRNLRSVRRRSRSGCGQGQAFPGQR